jgi:hypothetical protein
MGSRCPEMGAEWQDELADRAATAKDFQNENKLFELPGMVELVAVARSGVHEFVGATLPRNDWFKDAEDAEDSR